MKIRFLFFLFFLIAFITCSCAISGPIEPDKSNSEREILLPIDNWDSSEGWKAGANLFSRSNPNQDAENNFKAVGAHFLGVQGYSITFPGLDIERDKSKIDAIFSGRIKAPIIKETTDAIKNDDHLTYIQAARQYAKHYNTRILKLMGASQWRN